MTSKINLYCEDCLPAMRKMVDNQYDLAIVDPPYGIGDKFKGGETGKMNFNEVVRKGWDNVPNKEYFNQLFRISKNQIIWGGNYFDLPPTRCYLIWDKQISEDFSLAMCEQAWTSFDKLAKIFRYNNHKYIKFHPTQKPVALYKWLLKNYAKENDKILDTHFGSLSIGIACHDYGFDLDAYEIDKDYFEAGKKRLDTHKAQLQITYES